MPGEIPEQLKLEKQIEKFRIREIKELEQLEKISLKEKRDDWCWSTGENR